MGWRRIVGRRARLGTARVTDHEICRERFPGGVAWAGRTGGGRSGDAVGCQGQDGKPAQGGSDSVRSAVVAHGRGVEGRLGLGKRRRDRRLRPARPRRTLPRPIATGNAESVRKTFTALLEPWPDVGWQADFLESWPHLRTWYLSEGLEARPTVPDVRIALTRHMPELVPVWDRLCELAGDDPVAHSFLGLYGRPRVIGRCSQAVWLGAGGPALLRNYDFEPDRMMARIDVTRWFGRPVIAMGQAAWGCLDGMNGDGLAASLTFGGGKAYRRGFTISLLLRYVLETCRTVAEAAAALCRIPVAQSQNVTLVDVSGDHALVYLGPDRDPRVTRGLTCTNHQETVTWPEMAMLSLTVERHAALEDALAASPDIETLTSAMLAPPLYVRGSQTVTAYTAVYRPLEGVVDYLWPGKRWRQGFEAFTPGSYEHDYDT